MIQKKRSRLAIVLICLSLAILGMIAWMAYVYLQHERFNATLINAIERNDSQTVQVLLTKGADPNARWHEKTATLLDFCKQMFSGGQRRSELTGTALMYAASGGNIASVKALLAAGADVNARAEYGYTPLLCAIENHGGGSGAIIILMTASGADVHAKLNDGTTARELASTEPNIIKALDAAAKLQGEISANGRAQFLKSPK